MAHKKAAGSTKNLRDSNPKYLGVKLYDEQVVKTGNIIVRQRGTQYLPGRNVMVGKDHTLQAEKDGIVRFKNTRKTNFDGSVSRMPIVHVE